MRERIRSTVELIVVQAPETAIGAASSQRIGHQRAGYRHGHRGRTRSISLGGPPSPCRQLASREKKTSGTNGAARLLGAISGAARVDEAILECKGLAAALTAQSPKLAIQRGTNPKLWKLLARAPFDLREKLAEDYRRMVLRRAARG